MLAIVIPAYNEEEHIGKCLASVLACAAHPGLQGEIVKTVVVADSCTDRTAELASPYATVLRVSCRNVGAARAAGVKLALENGARWLAFTDADTMVSKDWLVAQLLCGADVVCGTVAIDTWPTHSCSARKKFLEHYTDRDGHRHIHGANLGVCAAAYTRAGGFLPLDRHEDVQLIAALERSGASICWSASPRVTTSARLDSKMAEGFGATLKSWNANAASSTAPLIAD